ncbi:MAG: SH3 domain-containing protein [Dehalococcoidia bacterium]|nr:SH3 domain-containing protein [Dehalococcoidia bacterium]
MVTTPGQGWVGTRHSRRTVLTAAAIAAGGVAAGGGAGLALLLTRGSSEQASPTATPPTSPPGSTPTAAASPTPFPSPSSTPGPGLVQIEPAPGAFEQRTFASGERIPWHEGVFFMDTSTGAITGIRVAGAAPTSEYISMTVCHAGRWVSAQRGPEPFVYLFDRDTGRAWRYPSTTLLLEAATAGELVFAALAHVGDKDSFIESGEYLFADADMREVDRIVLPGVSNYTRWSRQAGTFSIAYLDDKGLFRMWLLDGHELRDVRFPGVPGKQPWGADLEPDARGGFRGIMSYYEVRSDVRQPIGDPTYVTVRVLPTGEVTEFRPATGLPFESGSPDGRYIAEEVTLFQRPAIGEGTGERWTAVTVSDGGGEPLFCIRSAAIRYGDNLPSDRWLADSSGFVAQFRGDIGRPYDFRHGIVRLDGSIELLPRVPLEEDQWFRSPRNLGPVPAPFDADLLSFGRFYLYNRRTGSWFIPDLEDENGPAHWGGDDSPWAGRPGEMMFALGHGGHGGMNSPILIEPWVDRPPIAGLPAMRFRVSGTGSCLNLRELPSQDSPVLACLADGTMLTLDPDGAILWENATQGYSTAYDETGAWVLVRTAAGKRGWVYAGYLAWAP